MAEDVQGKEKALNATKLKISSIKSSLTSEIETLKVSPAAMILAVYKSEVSTL